MAKGSGPRHFTFHPNGRLAFVICELNSTIVSVRFDADRGSFSPLGTVSTTFSRDPADNHCSDIQIHPSGMFVCGANRGQDTIATFSVDPGNGDLSPLQQISCGGATPRHLAFDPTGNFLLVANQNSDKISVFHAAPSKSPLSPAAHDMHIGSPMCVKFLPQARGA